MSHLPLPNASTQEQFPWKTTLRTTIQVGVPTLLTLLVVVPIMLQILVDELGPSGSGIIPENATAWLLGASGVIISLSAAITRIMAIPAVNSWLSLIGLAPEPKSVTRGQGTSPLGS